MCSCLEDLHRARDAAPRLRRERSDAERDNRGPDIDMIVGAGSADALFGEQVGDEVRTVLGPCVGGKS